jgi:hypothetical protein
MKKSGQVFAEDFNTLSQLRFLDERIEAAGHHPLLDATDRKIIDCSLARGRIDCEAHAETLGVHRSTVWRRMKRLLADAPAIDRYGKTLLGEAEPQSWEFIAAMAKVLAERADTDGLSVEDYNKLAAMSRAGHKAHRLLNPPILIVESRGDKLVITGPGPLLPIERDMVRTGKAERIFDGPPRCHTCRRFISRPPTGRPSKYCSERCRSRYRRRR